MLKKIRLSVTQLSEIKFLLLIRKQKEIPENILLKEITFLMLILVGAVFVYPFRSQAIQTAATTAEFYDGRYP